MASEELSRQLMLGNEAVARAAYEAGATVATAYPGTPSTEITENIAKYKEIYSEWSPNEKVALEVAIGASIAGARAICSMKHVGLNVAADPLFTVSYTGVRGGLVIMVADDPGMHSSQNEQDSRYYGLSAKAPVLEPSDSQECLDYVKEAFAISEDFDTPVIVRLSTRVAHSRSLVAVSERSERPLLEYKKDIAKYVMMPAMARARRVIVEKRMEALAEFSCTTRLNGVVNAAGAGSANSAAGAASANGAAGAAGANGAAGTTGANGAAGAASANGAAGAADTTGIFGTPGTVGTPGDVGTTARMPLIITSGISWQYTREALRSLGFVPGINVSVLKLGMVYPMPKKLIMDFLMAASKVLIVEELSPFMEDIIRAYGTGIEIIGGDMLPSIGELSTDIVQKVIVTTYFPEPIQAATQIPPVGDGVAGAASPKAASAQPEAVVTHPEVPSVQPETVSAQPEAPMDLPIRPPVLCPGCPHRSVFYVLKKLNLIVCGDIGCYTLGALQPLQAIDTCICMGAGVSMAHGMDKAGAQAGEPFAQRTVAVIGDSTFMHSGMTSLLDIVYNKGSSTVLILDNEITGMTGHQPNPSTGRTLSGGETFRVDLVKLCEALGVGHVRVEDPFDVVSLEKAVREETARPEPSVIIVRRPCALLSSFSAGEAVAIDQAKCTRCRMCMRISCAAISDKDGEIQINQALCVKCGLCATICRFGAIVPLAGLRNGGGANG